MSDDFVIELQSLLASPVLRQIVQDIEREDQALVGQNLRNEVQADWLSNVFDRMSRDVNLNVESHQINKETGQPHTVESMVEEYHKKIGLSELISKANEDDGESVAKVASIDIPLSSKQADYLFKKKEYSDEELSLVWQRMKEFIDSHLKSHRGYSDAPAILYDLKDAFGSDLVNMLYKKITDEVVKQKQAYDVSDIRQQLPNPNINTPRKLDFSQDNDQLFEDMGRAR